MWVTRPVLVVLVLVFAGSVTNAAGQSAPAESAWRSAAYYGGTDFEFAERFAVDGQGNAYLLGRTFSADLHSAVVPASASLGERATATFVLKLSPSGVPIYAAPLGTGFAFQPVDIAVAADGTAHVLARYGDVTHVITIAADGRQGYHVTFDAFAADGVSPKVIGTDDVGHTVLAGWRNTQVFVARLDARGSVYDMTVLPLRADVRDLAIDAVGDAYVVGTIAAEGLPTTTSAVQPRYNGGSCSDPFPPLSGVPERYPCADAFLLKLTRQGTVAYATYFGGTAWDEGTTVAVDATGAAVVAGLTRSTDLPVARAMQAQCNPGFAPLACGDAFIAKLDPAGSLVFATYLGGLDTEAIAGVAVDAAGSTYIAGTITGDGLPLARAVQATHGGGRTDGFIAALGPLGDLLWSTYVGGSDDDRVVGVGAAAGIVSIGGETMSPAWATGGAAHHGARDLFSAKLWDSLAR